MAGGRGACACGGGCGACILGATFAGVVGVGIGLPGGAEFGPGALFGGS